MLGFSHVQFGEVITVRWAVCLSMPLIPSLGVLVWKRYSFKGTAVTHLMGRLLLGVNQGPRLERSTGCGRSWSQLGGIPADCVHPSTLFQTVEKLATSLLIFTHLPTRWEYERNRSFTHDGKNIQNSGRNRKGEFTRGVYRWSNWVNARVIDLVRAMLSVQEIALERAEQVFGPRSFCLPGRRHG